MRMNVSTMIETRLSFQKENFTIKKVKNSLCGVAIRDTNRDFLRGLFKGDVVLIYPTPGVEAAMDAPAMAEKLLKLQKENADHVLIVGGALDSTPLYIDDVRRLSKLPSERELFVEVGRALRTPLVRTAKAVRQPLVNFGRAVKAPLAKAGRALDARSRKLEEGGEPAPTDDAEK